MQAAQRDRERDSNCVCGGGGGGRHSVVVSLIS